MGSLNARTSRIVVAVKLAAAALIALVGVSVLIAVPASAASAPVVGNGNAGYTPGTTSPPNQFNALTLVNGGASSVNTASLTIVTQPASGSATDTTSSSTGIITYTPASGTTGDQVLTFAYCAPGDTYPSTGNCTTATLTYAPSTGQYFGGEAEDSSGGDLASVTEEVDTSVTAPSTAVEGSNVTVTVAPTASTIPASDDGITVESASQFALVMPVPTGFTYVPGSITATGGDATTSGNFAATYCTAAVADACTAHIDSGNYKTVYPYIEGFLNPATTVGGGDNMTLPTVTAQFTASGSAGTVVPVDFTEFALTTTVDDIGAVSFDGYPSCSSCGSSSPPTYSPPVPQATTTITGVPTVTGVSPDSGPPAGGTTVTISGTSLADASAVDFGTTPATVTADSATSITATSPAGTGTVDVTVTTPQGTSAISPADQFAYVVVTPAPTLASISPSTGPAIGGTDVTVTGNNLENATAVDFGPGNPGVITADSDTSITATSPAGTGTVDITVTTPSGTSMPVPADQYSFGVQGVSKLSTWTDTQACGITSTVTAPALASEAVVTANGGPGGGGGGAASSDSGGSGGSASSLTATIPVGGGGKLTAVSGCAGATAPNGSGVVSTGGAGGAGYSAGGGGGNGYYCAGIDIEGECIGDGGADGSGGGGGGSSAVCAGTSCQAGTTPLAVAAGGGGGGESMCAGSGGGGGGTGGAGSSTPDVDLTGAGPSGTNGGMGATSGDVGGDGGVNNTGDSPGGTAGGPGSNTVSAGDSAGNGGGGGGYVGGMGSTATAGVDCGAGGGGGAGSSWAIDGSGATFGTTSASGAVSLTFYGFVGTSPAISTNPTNSTVDAGQTATFTASASGNPAPNVQWQVSTDGGTTFTDVAGGTSDALSLATVAAADNGNEYQAVFTNSIGTQTTTPATLTVDSLPTVTTQPTDVSVVQGQPASFTAAATGNPTPTVQWQVSTNGGVTFTNIGGATSDTYTVTTAAGESGNQYQAVFINSVGSATSTPATLTLDTMPSVTTQPTDVSVIEGHTASFTAAASGNPTPTVQWQMSTNGGVTFTNIGGATSDTYAFAANLGENNYQYQAIFTNIVGSTTSQVATLTVSVTPPLTITTTSLPAGTLSSKSSPAVYSATLNATGGNPPYKWSLVSGSLPPGLKLKKTGVISGKASFAGNFTFTVKVVDTKTTTKPKTQNSATQTFSITIAS
jgi:hypothetical protein